MLFDYKCPECKSIEEYTERGDHACPTCGAQRFQYFGNKRIQMGSVFHGYWDTSLNKEPTWIGSKAQIKEICASQDKAWGDPVEHVKEAQYQAKYKEQKINEQIDSVIKEGEHVIYDALSWQ